MNERLARRGPPLIVGAGFAASVVIFLTAKPPRRTPLEYDATDSKAYLLEMERYGGKANVLATQVREWFDGLWQGRNLAITVFVLSLLAALIFWFLTVQPGPHGERK